MSTSAAPPGALQSALQCPSCAGQCTFDPAHQALTCLSCGEQRNLDHPDDDEARIEYGYDPDHPETEPLSRPEQLEHACQTCGGTVYFTGTALSESCPYCAGPVVLSQPGQGYDTMALIPFKLGQGMATENAWHWVGRRLAAPSDLAAHISRVEPAGLYAPFWTFDSAEAVQYWAKYTTGSGKNRRTRSVSGRMKIAFDDLLVPASEHVSPLIRDGILHAFDPRRLRPYRVGYLAGFAAERHHQTVAEGLRANASDKDLLIRNRIKLHIGKSRITSLRYRTDSTGIHYRRILLPVWVLHYSYGGKPHKIVVSGINGRTFGERPFSLWKLAGYAAGLSALTIAVGLAWGAAGFL